MQQREQKRIEDEIKALRRLPGNKKCADCKSLSNPYVCSDYNTFVCTRCSGIHRELGHRVKSVTAEIFTREEVAALKKGGNLKHNAVYLATWKETDFPEPAADDNRRIQKWFEEKYVRRRWYREQTAADNNFQAPAQQPQQQQQQQQQPQQPQPQVPVQQPVQMQMNAQASWGVAAQPAPVANTAPWGAPNAGMAVQQQPQPQQANPFNPFQAAAPAPAPVQPAPVAAPAVTANTGFPAGGWGTNAVAQPAAQPQPQPQSNGSIELLGLLMNNGSSAAPAPAPAPVSNNTNNNAFGGFGATATVSSTTTANNNAMFGMGMNTTAAPTGYAQPQPQQPAAQMSFQANTTTTTTTMNPYRAQPLSRGQSNNPFAGLVDMAPSVSTTQPSTGAQSNNTGLDSLFSTAPQTQPQPAAPAQPAKSFSLIDF